MCANYHKAFDNLSYFIRFSPEVRPILLCSELSAHQKQSQKFVFVNYSDNENLQPFHGRVVGLDISDGHAPFASIFIIHGMRVRGNHPFAPAYVPDNLPWQDWISSRGVLRSDGTVSLFKRDRPAGGTSTTVHALTPIQDRKSVV